MPATIGQAAARRTPRSVLARLPAPEALAVVYERHEMVDTLRSNGPEVVETRGIDHAAVAWPRVRFSMKEVATQRGRFADIESGNLLNHLCRRAEEVR